MKDRNLNRAEFPEGSALQGMAAQANTWFLIQMDEQNLTAYEALYIANEMLNTVFRLIGKEEAKAEKRRGARKKGPKP
jgi:hypothetical protein